MEHELFWGYAGEVSAVHGEQCLALLCVHVREGETLTPCLCWLNTADGAWHRFFLDAELGDVTWKRYGAPLPGDFDDPDDYPVVDLGATYDLIERQLVQVVLAEHGVGVSRASTLTITFSGGRILIWRRSATGTDLTVHSLRTPPLA